MSENPFGVRHATAEDVDAVAAFVRPLKEEEAVQSVSEARVRTLVERCVADGVVGIVDCEDGILSSVGILLDRFDYTEESHVRVKWLGVAPKYRVAPLNTGHAAQLMRFAKWTHAALERSVGASVPFILEILTAEDVERKIRLLQRQAPQIGAYFGWGVSIGRVLLETAPVGAEGHRAGPPRGSAPRDRARQPTAAAGSHRAA